MNKKYTYLFREVGQKNPSSYFIPLKMQPVTLSYILQMLARTNSSLRRFQIGIQTEKNKIKKVKWNSTIYNICDGKSDVQTNQKNTVILDKNFKIISTSHPTILQIIKNYIKPNDIVR